MRSAELLEVEEVALAERWD